MCCRLNESMSWGETADSWAGKERSTSAMRILARSRSRADDQEGDGWTAEVAVEWARSRTGIGGGLRRMSKASPADILGWVGDLCETYRGMRTPSSMLSGSMDEQP